MASAVLRVLNSGALFPLFLSFTSASFKNDYHSIPYGTKSTYRNALTFEELEIIENVAYQFVPSTCRPAQVNMVTRHGTRYPNPRMLDKFQRLSQKLQGKRLAERWGHLNQWVSPYSHDEANVLTSVGKRELQDMGKRVARRYHSLFDEVAYDEVLFYSSSKDRCIDSTNSFQLGMSKELDQDVASTILIRDDILRFYDNCTSFNTKIKKDKKAVGEYHKFRNGPEVSKVAEAISDRLGLRGSAKLTSGEVSAAFSALAFEEALSLRPEWKGLFDKEHMEVMSYLGDLKQYWTKGNAYKINYEQSCPLLTNIYTHIKEAQHAIEQGTRYTKGIFQFGHAETTLPLQTLLGLHQDREPLLSDNYKRMRQREFMGHRIAPFAGNVGIVLYQCDPDTPVPKREQLRAPPYVSWPKKLSPFMVQLLVQEQPVRWPFSEHHLLPLEEVEEYYKHYVTDCHYDLICELHPESHIKDEL